jgi:hypothetical protein
VEKLRTVSMLPATLTTVFSATYIGLWWIYDFRPASLRKFAKFLPNCSATLEDRPAFQ